MAVQYNNLGRYSVTLYVSGLNSTTTYRSIYMTIDGKTSPNLAKSSASSTSNGWSVSGLDCGTPYHVTYRLTSIGGNTRDGFGTVTTLACPVVTPAPSTPSYVSAVASTLTPGRISVSWSESSYAEYYTVTIRRNGAYIDSQIVYETSANFGGLGEGISYEVIVVAYNSSGQSGQAYAYVTTHDFTPPAPGYVSVVTIVPSTQTIGVVYLSWSSATNATNYRYEIYTVDHAFVTSGGTSDTSATVSGLSQHTTYYAKVYAQNGNVNGIPNDLNYFTTHDFRPPIPGDISSVSAVASTATKGRLSVSWTASSNASGYKVEIYRSNGVLAQSQVDVDSSTRSYAFTGLLEYTEYYVKVYGYNERGNGTPTYSPTTRTADLTPPVLSNVRGDGDGRAYISWSASDSHSGIRSSNPFYVQISSPNGSTYGNGAYTSNYFRTFTTDAAGNDLSQDAYYYLRVSAYDNSGNSSTETIRVQYKMKRPSDWTWNPAKTSGQAVNLTAAEWNSFCTRINQFRIYKSMSNYDFTEAVSGQPMLASQVNEARTAIQQMAPPITTPKAVVSGGDALASFINGLSTSLNSIT